MAESERFYWCVGCGRWEDSRKNQSTHFAMYCPFQEPTSGNFEGTDDELRRFLIARELRLEESAEFEAKITARMEG